MHANYILFTLFFPNIHKIHWNRKKNEDLNKDRCLMCTVCLGFFQQPIRFCPHLESKSVIIVQMSDLLSKWGQNLIGCWKNTDKCYI